MAETVTSGGQFRVGTVLGRGFSILFGNFFPFMFMALLIYSPLIIYTAMIDARYVTADDINTWMAVTIIGSLSLTMILTAALVYGTFQELRGRHATIGECLSQGLSRILPVLGVALLVVIATLGGMVLLIIPGIIVATMLWVSIPVAVLEKPGVINSLKRSAELTKGDRWRVLGIIFIMNIIENILSKITEIVEVENVIVPLMLGIIVMALVGALEAVVTAVGYHDLRTIKEGVDIDEIAAVFD